MLLLLFQWVAMFTQGFWVRGRGIVTLVFYVVKFIGYSYRAALDPENGFILSFVGFTCAVGLCEELCKAAAVAVYLTASEKANWRGAFLVGLASGVGFGISEGITYSTDYYNGLHPGLIYAVRFASCVALHAIWAGSVAILMYNDQSHLSYSSLLEFILFYLGIAMILHGLYDTLLKRDMPVGALVVAAVSLGWMAFLFMNGKQAHET